LNAIKERLTPPFQDASRRADGWESPRFQAGFWLKAGSGKAALPRPAHPQLMPAVRQLEISTSPTQGSQI